MEKHMDKRVGIYIHIPFCASKCAYCNFYSLAGKDRIMPEFHDALIRHIRECAPVLDGYLIDTVYFGGGTPSHYGAGRLISVLSALKKYGHVLLSAEITAEVNPGSVTRDELTRLRRAGFNRLSVGVQSANDTMLKNLGRPHSFQDAEEAVRSARQAGFTNVSVDVIYGLPSQSREDWADSLTRIAALKPEHISCYGLKIEQGTQLYIFKDSPFLPDDDMQADMYLYSIETLARYGYKQYEISNFSRKGFESRHNLKYWLGEEYIGFGPAAHSCVGNSRYGNIENIEKYIERINTGKAVIDHGGPLSEFEKAAEYLMLRLRTVHGISEEEYYAIYKLRMDFVLELLRKYEENGFAYFKDGRWRLTSKGFLVSNTLIRGVLDAQTKQRTQTSRPWQVRSDAEGMQMTLFEKDNIPVGLFGKK